MLTKRIIPCLDINMGRVVKGVSFVNLYDAGDPTELAEYYNRAGADELVFLDITASSGNREIILDVVKSVSEKVFGTTKITVQIIPIPIIIKKFFMNKLFLTFFSLKT